MQYRLILWALRSGGRKIKACDERSLIHLQKGCVVRNPDESNSGVPARVGRICVHLRASAVDSIHAGDPGRRAMPRSPAGRARGRVDGFHISHSAAPRSHPGDPSTRPCGLAQGDSGRRGRKRCSRPAAAATHRHQRVAVGPSTALSGPADAGPTTPSATATIAADGTLLAACGSGDAPSPASGRRAVHRPLRAG